LDNWGEDNQKLSQKLTTREGMATAGNPIFLRNWFEVAYNKTDFSISKNKKTSLYKWFPYNKGGSARRWYGNQELVVNWEHDGLEIKSYPGAVVSNPTFYFRKSISWGLISGPLFRFFPEGFIYDVQGMSTFYDSEQQMYKDIAWLNTKVFNAASRIISPAGHS
jgi:hypothetical protein